VSQLRKRSQGHKIGGASSIPSKSESKVFPDQLGTVASFEHHELVVVRRLGDGLILAESLAGFRNVDLSDAEQVRVGPDSKILQ